ncbi:hypothetical protein PV05_01552 [Exophiala xenobiotica]|uniref:Fork-head domain-containing protein n=1 Tax=Exophiala xenobiotica TaxID=348802 RepID=A0A0D2C8Z5_9EURO|nr:uncharacterized protein PV05_01552 [Exophiala xenobiotica]KIW61431.1 hypothetical protein PV05_01552 [Exophiala xenobiotica]
MSSQAIATSTRGLPDFPSEAIDLHDFEHPAWSGPSNLHEHASQPQDEVEQCHSNETPASDGNSWVEMDAQQRKQAVGNLLAALAPMSPTQTATTTNGTTESILPPTTSEVSGKQAEASEYTPNGNSSTNNTMNTDPTVTMSLPPLPPLSTDDFLDENAPPFPSSFPQDPFDPSQATLIGEEPLTMTQGESQPPIPSQDPQPERREIEAFAKIEFEDGNYYITTYACELGRDAFAYRAALTRAEQARQAGQDAAQSSSGRRSGLSEAVPRPGESQVQGSVVSEAGGFGGVDEAPLLQNGEHDDGHPMDSHSSERSGGSVVKPQEVLINPPLIPFDYHKMAERQAQLEHEHDPEPDNEQPAPVTADHIPDAHNCPLIPIHAMRNFQKSEVENHRSISRRHVKIQWDFDKECFQMKVLGRNGAFLDDQYLQRGSVKRLRDGSKIQISNVWMSFRLPSQNAEPASEESEHEEAHPSPPPQRSTSPTSDEIERSASPPRGGKTKLKITLNTAPQKPSHGTPDPLVGPDGQPMPPKKRGPGRPPKDGVMSNRERKEREKAAKDAAAKAANGGKTPPPLMKGKFPKPAMIKEEPMPVDSKPEKRKYKKRKRPGEDGDVVPSIEGGEIDVLSETETPPVKKARQSKSPSPDYPAAETLNEEQLARPSEPYARLIYDILIDVHPQALPLKLIYRALKLKFPFFVHRVDSEGWQSSVRHNLNQEWNKLFEKDKKEGKGWAWKAIPGALQPQAERRRAAQQAAASKPKPNPAPRQHSQQGPPPPLNWQNNMSYPQQNGMPPRGAPPTFFAQAPNGSMPPPPNGMPYPAPFAPGGSSSSIAIGGAAQSLPPGQLPNQFYPPAHGARPPSLGQQPGTGQQAASNQNLSSATPGPPPPAPASSSASRNMPCTTDGLLAIRRFETAMYNNIDPHQIETARKLFASAQRRMLHGATYSSMVEGECKEEHIIMEHIQRFINRYKNPNFVGFSNTGSPAPPNPTNMAPSASVPGPMTIVTAANSTKPANGPIGGAGNTTNNPSTANGARPIEPSAASPAVSQPLETNKHPPVAAPAPAAHHGETIQAPIPTGDKIGADPANPL